jgi:SP family sugar:H+ symporter-like MFS transporter
MIWTIAGELYPSRYRAKGMALSTASNWFWNFLLAFFTPFITGDIDFRYGYVFAGCNVLGGLVVYFFVIEGQGRTLEEIDTMYIQRVIPWQSNKWIAPPASEIARIRAEAGTGDVPRDVAERQNRGESLGGATERASEEVETQRGSGELEKEAEHRE